MAKSERRDGWEVGFSQSALRQKRKLPQKVSKILSRLIGEMEKEGPFRKNWSHFSSLERDKRVPPNAYHCHIKNGRPTYVACWQIIDKKVQILEVFYVGTHENAPYKA